VGATGSELPAGRRAITVAVAVTECVRAKDDLTEGAQNPIAYRTGERGGLEDKVAVSVRRTRVVRSLAQQIKRFAQRHSRSDSVMKLLLT